MLCNKKNSSSWNTLITKAWWSFGMFFLKSRNACNFSDVRNTFDNIDPRDAE